MSEETTNLIKKLSVKYGFDFQEAYEFLFPVEDLNEEILHWCNALEIQFADRMDKEIVRRQYKKLIVKYHPAYHDTNEARFIEISQAYDGLKKLWH